MSKQKGRIRRALAITAIGVAVASTSLASKAYTNVANAQDMRHFTRSFAVKNGLVHHHRSGHKLNHTHKPSRPHNA